MRNDENSTMLDAGVLTICSLVDSSTTGQKPIKRLQLGNDCFYGERIVGYGRQYAAMGVSERIDMLVRIWQDRSVRTGMYVLLENGEQYRIGNVQHLADCDGLLVTDLSLERLDDLYEVTG